MTSIDFLQAHWGTPARNALAACLLSVALGGCYTTRDRTGDVPNDYRLRHPIALQERDRTLALFVGNARGGLTPSQRAEVLGFAQNWRSEATGGVVIEVPDSGGNARASADAVREVQSIVVAAGVPGNGVVLRPYSPVDPRKLAPIKVTYPKLGATAGPCGLWPADLGATNDMANYSANSPYWNLGCATQRNLASMVDNPHDLVQPRSEAPVYQARRNVVVDKFRAGKPTETDVSTGTRGKISDVGK